MIEGSVVQGHIWERNW
ncbi:hypothetical protein RDI58_013177 [Solanum bulbocastanum]|uniref:Uncharacterized protein n=1 Tax=Solanum bulbocastanum TaxID=147425 RepID=A0AAN8TJ26_SOLBU